LYWGECIGESDVIEVNEQHIRESRESCHTHGHVSTNMSES